MCARRDGGHDKSCPYGKANEKVSTQPSPHRGDGAERSEADEADSPCQGEIAEGQKG